MQNNNFNFRSFALIILIVFYYQIKANAQIPPSVPSSVTATPSTITCGGNSSLNATTSGSNVIVRWWDMSVGGTMLATSASGANYIVMPFITTTYYAESFNKSNSTASISRASITVYVNTLLQAPTNISVFPDSISCGNSTNLYANSYYVIKWWDAPAGGNFIATSQNGLFFNTIPPYTTTYYCESYTSKVDSAIYNYSGSIVTWNVPAGITKITIDVRGASGGYRNASAGKGSRMIGDFNVNPGDVLSILVGQSPGVCNYPISYPGGGGGSFVAFGNNYSTSIPMIVAGGGGGANSTAGQNAPVTINGTGQNPGTFGNGAPSGNCGGGGGGFYTSGGNDLQYDYYGGNGFRQGGGATGSNNVNNYQPGGFGGGAEADNEGICYSIAGSGGGYSGGSAKNSHNYSGEAGGSYNSGSNQINTPGFNTGNGLVKIYWSSVCASSRIGGDTVKVQGNTVVSGISSNPITTYCSGSSNLVANSPGNIIRWWDSSFNGTLIGSSVSGAIFIVNPTTTMNYYAEAFNGTCVSIRLSVTVSIYSIPPPSNFNISPGTIYCGDTAIIASSTFLGTVRWWDSPVGGNFIGTSSNGTSFKIRVTINATYYAEAFYDPCISSRVSLTIIVSILPTPTSVTANPNNISCGGNSNISASTNYGIIRWWDALSGGNLIGTSQSGQLLNIVPPVGITTYYAEAFITQGSCSSLRSSVTITLTNTVLPPNVSAGSTNLNCGSCSSLSAVSTVNDIRWWDAPVGGNYLGATLSGSVFFVCPDSTTVYYAEAYLKPCASTRVSVTVFINPITSPTTVSSIPTTITCGASVNLYALNNSGTIRWWDAIVNGNLLGSTASGAFLSVFPFNSTTYYAESYSGYISSLTFNYTGSIQSWIVPNNVNNINIIVNGAQGYTYPSYNNGGLGGRVQATLNVIPGQLLNIFVGGQGGISSGGWNGGANGDNAGGGSSDIRVGGTALINRIVVAGGGGGGGYCSGCMVGNGGDGGGLIGNNGLYRGVYYSPYSGAGGSQTSGGMGATGAYGGNSGSFGIGGTGVNMGGGGGGGYYGGGGGGFGGGGGGSSWADTTILINVIHTQGYKSGDGQIVINSSSPICVSSRIPISTPVIVNPIQDPIYVVAIPDTITCSNSSNLNAISSGNIVRWWSLSTGGVILGSKQSGVNFSVAPINTTTYYAQSFYNGCISANMLSITVNVTPIAQPTSITASTNNICVGFSSSLSAIVSLGKIRWYDSLVGGTLIGSTTSGQNLVISPTISTTYFAENYYNNCISATRTSISIIVGNPPVVPSYIYCDTLNICPSNNGNITLSTSGGSGSILNWYNGNCGNTVLGTGNPYIIAPPTITTTYWANYQSQGCSNSACLSITISLIDIPTTPQSVSTSINNYCSNAAGNITLSISGGSGLKTGWYRTSCGGTFVGTGNSLIMAAPTITSKFYVRRENICGQSSCLSITITVNSSPSPPVLLTSSVSNVCFNTGGSISLSASGGYGTSFGWYTGACGASSIGATRNLTIATPAVTTTYWGRTQTSSCGSSTCLSITIYMFMNPPNQTDTIIGNNNPLTGTNQSYRVTDIPGISYTWSAPSGWYGNSTTSSINYIVGNGSGSITVVPSNACGTGPTRTLVIQHIGNIINGYVLYMNSSNTPMDSVWLFLCNNGNVIDSVQADSNGFYQFTNVLSAEYNISAKTQKMWSGVNATDAVKVKRHFAGAELFAKSILLHAADVNLSFNINTTDAVKLTRRFVGSDTSFIRGDWVFEKPTGGDSVNVSVYLNDTITVNGNNVTQNIAALCIGDVNGSNYPSPGAKFLPKVNIEYSDYIKADSYDSFMIPVTSGSNESIGAMSLILNFPKDLVTIERVQFIGDINGENLIYNIRKDELRIGWFDNNGKINIRENNPFLIIRGKTTHKFKKGDAVKIKIAENNLNEFADESGNTIDNVKLKIATLIHSEVLGIENQEGIFENDLFLFPNPAEKSVNIKYNIAHDGNVRVTLYNIIGEKVFDLIDKTLLKGTYTSEIDLSKVDCGVYTCKMIIDNKISIVKRFIVSK